jgi:hypothetical protein
MRRSLLWATFGLVVVAAFMVGAASEAWWWARGHAEAADR